MVILKTKKKIYDFSIGSLTGVSFHGKRNIPNYAEFESKHTVIIGKVVSNKHPMFDCKRTELNIFFCFRLFIKVK